MIKKLTTTTVYQNKWLSVREDTVIFDNKVEGIYAVVDKADCVMILPFDGEFFYLDKQYRYPIQQYFIEFPAGSHEESSIENELQLVKAELQEETGLISKKITKLGVVHEVPATVNQTCHLFFAEELSQGKQNLEETEVDLKIIKLSQPDLENLIKTGEISDAKTLAGFLLWKLGNR